MIKFRDESGGIPADFRGVKALVIQFQFRIAPGEEHFKVEPGSFPFFQNDQGEIRLMQGDALDPLPVLRIHCREGRAFQRLHLRFQGDGTERLPQVVGIDPDITAPRIGGCQLELQRLGLSAGQKNQGLFMGAFQLKAFPGAYHYLDFRSGFQLFLQQQRGASLRIFIGGDADVQGIGLRQLHPVGEAGGQGILGGHVRLAENAFASPGRLAMPLISRGQRAVIEADRQPVIQHHALRRGLRHRGEGIENLQRSAARQLQHFRQRGICRGLV